MKIKLWDNLSYAHRFLMKGLIFAGLLVLIFGICFRDKELVLISFGIMAMGIIVGGLQSLAWKQWEERKKKQAEEDNK